MFSSKHHFHRVSIALSKPPWPLWVSPPRARALPAAIEVDSSISSCLRPRKSIFKLRVMFLKLPSLLFLFLINSSRFTMFIGTHRRHPELSTVLDPSSDFPLVHGELAMSCSPSLYLPFDEWWPEMLFRRTPARFWWFRSWRRHRSTVDGRRFSLSLPLDKIWAIHFKSSGWN
jgi:hypothetical protein